MGSLNESIKVKLKKKSTVNKGSNQWGYKVQDPLLLTYDL